jgi:glutathione S-transferase
MHTDDPLILYDNLESGNGHKVRLLLGLLNRDYTHVLKDIHAGETRTDDFLQTVSPIGRIPVLQLGDGRTIPESNAILTYLAEGTPYLPEDAFTRARVLSWLFWEQYEHEPNIAVARFWVHHLEIDAARAALLEEKRAKGRDALALMNLNFTYADWCVGTEPTVADIALYSYTSVAEEGGIALGDFPAVRQWLARVEALPGFIPMIPFEDLA